ncbi:hypothetical protein, partial [Leptospira interrogans]
MDSDLGFLGLRKARESFMEDKNKTIKETLQGSADAGKRKKLIIKKKGDDPSTPSPAASPKKETVAESAPSSKP